MQRSVLPWRGVYPVSGRLVYHGAPAAGAAVFFHYRGARDLGNHLTMGIVGDDGTFELVYGPLGKGAPPELLHLGHHGLLLRYAHQPESPKN